MKILPENICANILQPYLYVFTTAECSGSLVYLLLSLVCDVSRLSVR